MIQRALSRRLLGSVASTVIGFSLLGSACNGDDDDGSTAGRGGKGGTAGKGGAGGKAGKGGAAGTGTGGNTAGKGGEGG
jgi:hypothetical protein